MLDGLEGSQGAAELFAPAQVVRRAPERTLDDAELERGQGGRGARDGVFEHARARRADRVRERPVEDEVAAEVPAGGDRLLPLDAVGAGGEHEQAGALPAARRDEDVVGPEGRGYGRLHAGQPPGAAVRLGRARGGEGPGRAELLQGDGHPGGSLDVRGHQVPVLVGAAVRGDRERPDRGRPDRNRGHEAPLGLQEHAEGGQSESGSAGFLGQCHPEQARPAQFLPQLFVDARRGALHGRGACRCGAVGEDLAGEAAHRLELLAKGEVHQVAFPSSGSVGPNTGSSGSASIHRRVTGMPIPTCSGVAPTRLVMSRVPSSSSTTATTSG